MDAAMRPSSAQAYLRVHFVSLFLLPSDEFNEEEATVHFSCIYRLPVLVLILLLLRI